MAKTDEMYASVTHGCIGFIDLFVFMIESVGTLVKTLKHEVFISTGKVFEDKKRFAAKTLAYPCEVLKKVGE